MNEQTWAIKTEDLKIGTVLNFDLLDANGVVLHKAGMPISDRLKERLRTSGITSVSIRGVNEAFSSSVEAIIQDSFDPKLLKALKASFEKASRSVQDAMEQVAANRPVNMKELESGAEEFVNCASQDLAATLSMLVTNQADVDAAALEAVCSRSVKLSLLAVTTALTQGKSESFAATIGLAGLLHDCSLVLHPEFLAKAINGTLGASEVEVYRSHPLESMDLLKNAIGSSDRLLEIISQVHEQADGTGFPLGLRIHECKYEALILNAADAYLTLTDQTARHRIVQSDALMYLINHASKGKFCPKVLQAMIKCMSIYPIGSVVVLDDESKAVVVRANADSPMKPMIRILNSAQQPLDLQTSRLSITAPFVDPASGFHRLSKAEISKVFWGLPASA